MKPLRELVRWSAICGLFLALVPTLVFLAVLNFWAKMVLTLADVLADRLEALR